MSNIAWNGENESIILIFVIFLFVFGYDNIWYAIFLSLFAFFTILKSTSLDISFDPVNLGKSMKEDRYVKLVSKSVDNNEL